MIDTRLVLDAVCAIYLTPGYSAVSVGDLRALLNGSHADIRASLDIQVQNGMLSRVPDYGHLVVPTMRGLFTVLRSHA